VAAACYVVVNAAGGVVGVGLDPNGPPTFPTRGAARRWTATACAPESPAPWRVATVREVYGPPSSAAVDEAVHMRAG
jgi:hypothetical protein